MRATLRAFLHPPAASYGDPREPRAKSQEPRAKSQEPRAKSQEPGAADLLWERTLCATNLRSGLSSAAVAHRVRSHRTVRTNETGETAHPKTCLAPAATRLTLLPSPDLR
ncbi:hypothetical protein GCM10027021_19010 [Dyella kyungheensis]